MIKAEHSSDTRYQVDVAMNNFVMKETGFLLEGSGKFSLIHAIFWP
jgi:hypothetical protein